VYTKYCEENALDLKLLFILIRLFEREGERERERERDVTGNEQRLSLVQQKKDLATLTKMLLV
jgi:hypothetical protein